MTAESPFSPGTVLALATAIRDNGSSATFCFGTDVKPFDSGNSLLYAVTFPDHVTWAVQVPVQAGTSLTSESLASFVGSQATTLTKLDKAGFRWSPKLIHHDTAHDNLIKHPYLVLSWIQGTALEWTDSVPSKPQDREKILHQIVNIQLDLAERTKDLRSGASTLQFLAGVVDGKIMRAATDQEPLFSVRDCLAHRALIRHVVHDSLELDPSIFVTSHEALAAHNIIVDSDYNITGIVDWCFARTIPLQLAFRLPKFLAIEPDSPKQTASPPPADVASFAKQYLHPSPALMADRYLVRSYLQSLVSDSEHVERGSLAQSMKDLFSDPDVNWRYLVIEACFSKGLHAWLVNRSWLLPGTNGDLANYVELPAGIIEHEVEELLKAEGGKNDTLRQALLKVVQG